MCAGQSLPGSSALHDSPTMQRLGSAGGLSSGTASGMVPTNRPQQQPGMHAFTQGLGQMSQGLHMDPSASPHQRHAAMYHRSFSPAGIQQLGGMSMHGQGGMVQGGLVPSDLSQQQMGQGRGMHLPGNAGMPGWQQMHEKYGKAVPDMTGPASLQFVLPVRSVCVWSAASEHSPY